MEKCSYIIGTGILFCSLSSFAINLPNGDFDYPLNKTSNPADTWFVQDSESGQYGGLVTKKYDHLRNENYVEISSHNVAPEDCIGINCHRAELFLNPDVADIGHEGQRTRLFFKFKIESIWDKDDPHCYSNTCYSTILQYLPEGGDYAVAPMMSFVLARYRQTELEPSISLQHKIHCGKSSNQSLYPSLCAGNEGKVIHWASDTFVKVEPGKWYEGYSHIYWSEGKGTLSAGIRAENSTWQYFEKDGAVFHTLPTRADDVPHLIKAGIYGYGIDAAPDSKELVLAFDDFRIE